jgi:hypothetical protein
LKITFWHEFCLWVPNLVIVKTIEGSFINVKYESFFDQWKLWFRPWVAIVESCTNSIYVSFVIS